MFSSILPTTINHNAAVVTTALQNHDLPSKAMSIVNDVNQSAVNQKYQSPIQVQAAALELHQAAGDNPHALQGAKLLADAAELPTKLPVFDVKGMQEAGVPQHLVDASQMLNQKLATGQDAETLKAQAEQVKA